MLHSCLRTGREGKSSARSRARPFVLFVHLPSQSMQYEHPSLWLVESGSALLRDQCKADLQPSASCPSFRCSKPMAVSLNILVYPLEVFSSLNLSLTNSLTFARSRRFTTGRSSNKQATVKRVAGTSTIRFTFICQRHCEGWLTVCLCLT